MPQPKVCRFILYNPPDHRLLQLSSCILQKVIDVQFPDFDNGTPKSRIWEKWSD